MLTIPKRGVVNATSAGVYGDAIHRKISKVSAKENI